MTGAKAPRPRTAAANAARRNRTETALGRVDEAITRLHREKTPVTVAAVARTFLYTNPRARVAVATAIAAADLETKLTDPGTGA